MAKTEIITVTPPEIKTAIIEIEGDGDLCLNKMNARNMRTLMAEDRKKVSEKPNRWEDVCTALHWEKPLLCTNTYKDIDEDFFKRQLSENAPCISAFGLKKSWGQTVVRQEIDKYSTKFDSAVNIIARNNLIPITFTEWSLDERLMSPKRGAPISVALNHFSGWKASITVQYTENVYRLNTLVNVINLAGFSIGIGSGRSSGYGRYHVVGVK